MIKVSKYLEHSLNNIKFKNRFKILLIETHTHTHTRTRTHTHTHTQIMLDDS